MTNQRPFENILASASQAVHCSPLFYKDCLEISFSARSFGSIASLTYKLMCIFPPTLPLRWRLHCAIHDIAESCCARLTQGIQLDFTNCLLDPVIHPAFFPPEREQQTRFIRSSSPRHYPMSRSSPKSSSTCLTNFAIAQTPSLSLALV
jgi:hypothetical protein